MRRLLAILLPLLLTGHPERPVPTPAPPPAQAASSAAALPGRLFFLAGGQVAVLEGGVVRTVPVPQGLRDPVLSPDGRRVAGVEAGTLVVVDLSSGETVRAEGTPVRGGPVWSPDGSRIAAFAAGGDGTTLLLFDPGGERRGEIGLPAGAEDPRAAWSPDGGRLAVEVGSQVVTDRSIWLADVSAGEATLLAERATAPLWAPDGRELLYAEETEARESITGVNLETGSRRTLLSEQLLGGASPSLRGLFVQNRMALGWKGWAPDGGLLGTVFKAAGADPRFVIVTLEPGGTGMQARVLPVFPDHPQNAVHHPRRPCSAGPLAWSPDSGRVASVLAGPGCEGTLSLMRADDLSPIADFAVPAGAKALFSPDGAWIVTSAPSTAAEAISLAGGHRRFRLPAGGQLLGWLD